MATHRITRRGFLGTALALAGAAGAGTAALTWHRRSSSQAKNAILIITDSMRRDAVGCYGSGWARTPHLDAFAARSVRFDRAFVSSFPTVPARHDLLTGQYTFTYKPWGALESATFTLPVLLHMGGYTCALIADTPHPFKPSNYYQRNFDHVEIIRGQEDDPYRTEPKEVHFPCDPKKLRDPYTAYTQYLKNTADWKTEEDHFCAQTMRKAAAWLESHHDRQPFFLYVDTYDPHEPWDAPRSYTEQYDPGYAGQEVPFPRYDLWKSVLTPSELDHCRALYRGETSMVDRWVGHLLDTIERLGLMENTMVIHLSDHGVMLGEQGYIGKSIMRNGVFQSTPLFPEMCRIPLTIYYPGCRPGTVLKALAQPVHIPATIAEFLGQPIPPAFAAPSLWPVLREYRDRIVDFTVSAPILSPLGKQIPVPTNEPSITDGRWLLIYSCAGWGDELSKHAHTAAYHDKRTAWFSRRRLDPMLFDLESDPTCARDVYRKNKDLAAGLHARFYEFLKKSRMRPEHLPYFEKLENS